MNSPFINHLSMIVRFLSCIQRHLSRRGCADFGVYCWRVRCDGRREGWVEKWSGPKWILDAGLWASWCMFTALLVSFVNESNVLANRKNWYFTCFETSIYSRLKKIRIILTWACVLAPLQFLSDCFGKYFVEGFCNRGKKNLTLGELDARPSN